MAPADGTHSFLPTAFAITESPFFAAELRAEEVRIADHKRNHQPGVSWSGMGSEPFKAMTVGDLIRNAEIARQRAEDFANSPRGAFLKAVKGIEQLPSFEADAERLRALFNRSLADDRQPVNVKAVGAALVILTSVPGKDARSAVDALAELLMGARV